MALLDKRQFAFVIRLDFETGRLSWIVRWVQCIDKGPYQGKREAVRSVRVGEGLEDVLLALKMEEGTQVILELEKASIRDSPLKPLGGTQPC